ncbi:MAG: protein-L-isoaspartate(D-aspartate) O-methyltransferase [Candidatus Pacebacteria bacterium]|jgi:protein-L-isoaspartate(D-aspartate) O-methyltransferase|nr:protein-L-isoaspartate O-methyltransferase [bacterium]MDP6527938.1 protein-L-isoaspartate(D-aspartate) O-methyltransferase [Candidatus Paceibacterota bacterium]MDP6659470.1 protein-L-isoaspartate(D-aspartate) O-methyltransferase [Candidatus Paceibacterota bacterium]|tara:strand:+ start:270 stop:881 length:612 start_codon:yes stop_codon:yes gene_type:complete
MKALINELKKEGVLKNKDILRAFENVDRKDFVPDIYQNEAYENRPLPTDCAQTISQPYTVAFMLELLGPKEGERILDVGSGSGWTTSLLSEIVGKKGEVIGTEIIPELVKFGQTNLSKYNFKNSKIVNSKGTLGNPDDAPYDRILVSAAAKILPEPLIEQLHVGGTMVIPVKDAIWKVTRTTELETDIEKHHGFIFVPLVTKP